jgi:hypothetical protein
MARKTIVVPQARQVLDELKYEIAAELGLPVGKLPKTDMANLDAEISSELGETSGKYGGKDDWGHISTRDAGAVGGAMTARLIRRAEEMLFSL